MLNIKYLLPIVALFFLSACAKKVVEPSLATLKPVMRVKVVDKASFPEAILYTLTMYNDQRLEFTGYASVDKIGNYTTMMSAKNQADFIAKTSQFKKGHFTFSQASNQLFYDVLYYPLKKEISMADAIQLPETPNMTAFIAQINDLVTYKKWLKKENAPKMFSDKDAGNMIVTLKVNTLPEEITKAEKYADMQFKAIKQTDKNSNTWLFGFAPGIKTADAVYKIKSHPTVLGAIPNTLLMVDENLKVFENQELIVQFKENVNIEEWVKAYSANGMKYLERVAPDLNYWLISYNSSTLGAKEMLARIKSDTKVSEAQMNRKVSIRE
jgi:hypothetical protein